MQDARPARRESEAAWELRGAWAAFREVVVSWPGGRVRGYVQHVSATDAFALIWDGVREMHIPLVVVSNIRRPHFSEPLDGEPVPRPPERKTIYVFSGQLEFDLGDV